MIGEMEMQIPLSEILTLTAVGLLLTTFGVVVRRSLTGWLSSYRYQSIVLAGSTAVIAYETGAQEIYAAAVLTLVIKAVIIPRLLVRVTDSVRGEFKIEANPYVSIRVSILISALLVALSYGLIHEIFVATLDVYAQTYLPVSLSLFFIGLFAMVSRRTALNQVVGLLIIENGLFLFTTGPHAGRVPDNRGRNLGRHPGRGDDLRHAPAQDEPNLRLLRHGQPRAAQG